MSPKTEPFFYALPLGGAFDYLVGKSTRPEVVELKSVIGPGDDFRPVLTIMYPYQD